MWHQNEEDFIGTQSEELNCLEEARMDLCVKNGKAGAEMAPLLEAGRFLVVSSGPYFCRATDGLAGTRQSLVGDFATREEAEARVQECYVHDAGLGDEQYYVLPRVPAPAPVVETNEDEIPF